MKHQPLKFALKLAPLALAVALSGCAVGPDYQVPTVTLAESYLYSADASQIDNDHWWLQFEDQTLNRLVKDLQQQNIPLKIAAERINMARSYQSVVESFKVPAVNLGAGYYNYQLSKNDSLMGPALNPIGDSVAGLPPQMGSAVMLDNQHDGAFVGASVMWEMDLFGRIEHQAQAAEIRVEQAEIYQSGLNILVTADLVHNYIQYRGAQARTDLLKENIADQRKTLDLVQKVVASGYGSDLDLAQARAMLAATQSLLPQLEIAQQVHKQRLATLLGEPLSRIDQRLGVNSLDLSDAKTRVSIPTIEAGIPTGLPSELLQRRPDIRIAEREIAAINSELAASVANRYPKFFLTGAPGVSASSFDDLFSSDSFGWAGSVGMSWNVFDGGRGESLVEINDARLESAMLGYQHMVNGAITEVDSMLFAYGRSQENQQQIDEAVSASQIALNKAKSLYKAGLVDHLTVLDAQRQHRMMLDRQLAAQLQTAQTTVGVYKSLGGDWKI